MEVELFLTNPPSINEIFFFIIIKLLDHPLQCNLKIWGIDTWALPEIRPMKQAWPRMDD